MRGPGIMATGRSSRLPPGIPGLLYLEFINYGRGTQQHVEKAVHLEKAYALERGYLPSFYEKKKTIDEFNEKVSPLLVDVLIQLDIMSDAYKPSFEGETCDPEEKEFNKIMRGIFERLIYIASYTGMIDTNVYDESSELFG